MHRILLDTNILLDSIIPNRPQHEAALHLLEWCNGSGDMGFAASTSLNDAYFILCKAYDETVARKAIENLTGLLTVIPVGGEECDLSLHSNEPDFEDGLIRACAELNDIDYIITRDKSAFMGTSVKSVTVEKFLEYADHEERELLARITSKQGPTRHPEHR